MPTHAPETRVGLSFFHRAFVQPELEEMVEGLAHDPARRDAEELHHLATVQGRTDGVELLLLA